MIKGLSQSDIDIVKERADEKLSFCKKTGDIIGTQIFSILKLHARVVYYPLGINGPWGFTGIRGIQNGKEREESFVAINSSIPMDCQVFAAAHELYHIWYGHNPEILPSDLLNDAGKAIDERKANRFAAEFLVDESLLRQEIELHHFKGITIKNILQLADIFVVPYRTMVKRLWEIGFISEGECDHFLDETEDEIEKYRIIYSLEQPKPDNRVVVDNLVELAVEAYNSKFITYEKLEYLLELCNLKVIDVGITKPEASQFPSEDELDSIMRE